MYYTYVLITPTTLVCLLFSTAIPTSLFIKQLFFILVIYIYGRVRAIPTYRVYRLYDMYMYIRTYVYVRVLHESNLVWRASPFTTFS